MTEGGEEKVKQGEAYKKKKKTKKTTSSLFMASV